MTGTFSHNDHAHQIVIKHLRGGLFPIIFTPHTFTNLLIFSKSSIIIIIILNSLAVLAVIVIKMRDKLK